MCFSCEVIRDRKTGDSLQYAFVEFEDKDACEKAYFKMDNVLIDDRRIHVDFSQSVSKFTWKGKGRLEINEDHKKQKHPAQFKKTHELSGNKYLTSHAKSYQRIILYVVSILRSLSIIFSFSRSVI